MHFDRGAIQAHMLAADGQNLLLLQPREDTIQHPRFTPTIHPRVDRMPVAKLLGQSPPFAAVLNHIKQRIEQLQIGHAHVPALPRQAIGDPLILSLSKPHTRHLALNYPNVQVVLTGSKGSVEWKHQNISAVFVELGLPYVRGYKPRYNYQELLRHVVEERLATAGAGVLFQEVAQVVNQPAEAPHLTDVLSILVPPPERDDSISRLRDFRRSRRNPVPRNFLKMESENRSLGLAGEEFVMHFEHERLWRAGKKHLAGRIDGQEGRLLLFVLFQRHQFEGVGCAGFGQRRLGAECARSQIAIKREAHGQSLTGTGKRKSPPATLAGFAFFSMVGSHSGLTASLPDHDRFYRE